MASRDGFSIKARFILTTTASTVGLGKIWGFPSEVSAGGGTALF